MSNTCLFDKNSMGSRWPGKRGFLDDGTRSVQILLADDNPASQTALRSVLQQHSVLTVGNGREALLALEAFQTFDVVLVNLRMQEMDGLAIAAAIRKAEKGGAMRIPLIAVTNQPMQWDRERCAAVGIDAYFAAPFSPLELFSVIEALTSNAAVAKRAPAVSLSKKNVLNGGANNCSRKTSKSRKKGAGRSRRKCGPRSGRR